MKYNFDNETDRSGTYSYKWDGAYRYFGTNDVIPLWIADMDFKAPPEVVEALEKRASHGIYGYTKEENEHKEPFIRWAQKRYGYEIEAKWIINTPGVVPAICAAIQSLTEKGDSVLIQPPVYPPFFSSIKNNERNLVVNQLKYEDGKYEIDFEDFEKKIKDENVKLFLLCNPQNPVGRVWSTEDLKRLLDICKENDVYVFSDEIHADIIYSGSEFKSVLTLSKNYYDKLMVATAPSKTFNIAGLYYSNIIIPDEKLRDTISFVFTQLNVSAENVFSIEAGRAVYEYGEDWVDELVEYLEGNAEFVVDFIKEKLPKIKAYKPESTYLMWLDFSELFDSQEKLIEFLTNDAKLGLNDGTTFSEDYVGFMRLNIASPRSIVKEGLERLERALNS